MKESSSNGKDVVPLVNGGLSKEPLEEVLKRFKPVDLYDRDLEETRRDEARTAAGSKVGVRP